MDTRSSALKSVPHELPMASAGARRVRRARAWRLAAVAASLAAIGFAIGFFWYIEQISRAAPSLDRPADGIVALTGGPERIADAIELLAAGRGKRLLITGVNRSTRAEEISQLIPRYHAMFNCCVDLDHSAVNTIGNAVETRRWAQERGFRSLVIVTSSFHMPRAFAELAHQMPDVTLIPYPVITERQRAAPWWASASSTKTLVFEYLKYLAAVVRMRIDPMETADLSIRRSILR
jgi:uncharacterized SAM-binding protein YcdF (DUF218 family)